MPCQKRSKCQCLGREECYWMLYCYCCDKLQTFCPGHCTKCQKYGSGFFSKWSKSIYRLLYFMLKNSVFCPCWSAFSVKHRKPVFFPKQNMGFQCLILNTDQQGKNTDFFSIKYGSPYIDLNHLEKNSKPYFGISRSATFWVWVFWLTWERGSKTQIRSFWSNYWHFSSCQFWNKLLT